MFLTLLRNNEKSIDFVVKLLNSVFSSKLEYLKRSISRFVLFWPCKDRWPEQNIAGYKSPQVYWTKSLLDIVTHYTSPAVVSCKCHSFQLLDPLANNVLEIGSTEQCAVSVQWQQASWISQISASLLEALQCCRMIQKSGGRGTECVELVLR